MSIANTLELAMLALINDERAEAGLSPLRMITLLNQAAEDHSSWMLENDSFSHEGADDTSPSDRMAGAGYPFEGHTMALENIGWQSARGLDGHADDAIGKGVRPVPIALGIPRGFEADAGAILAAQKERD